MRFLELDMSYKVPDAKMVWHFRETLTKAGVADELFLVFRHHLEGRGIITHSGAIVDASFVVQRKQNMSKEQGETVKNGKVPQKWQGKTNKL